MILTETIDTHTEAQVMRNSQRIFSPMFIEGQPTRNTTGPFGKSYFKILANTFTQNISN